MNSLEVRERNRGVGIVKVPEAYFYPFVRRGTRYELGKYAGTERGIRVTATCISVDLEGNAFELQGSGESP